MKIVLSSGHGLHVRGARGIIDEVDEARRVVHRVGELLGREGAVFHENAARTVRDNVNNIVRYHNGHVRHLDVSVHFNSFNPTSGFTQRDGWREVERGVGVEVLYRAGDAKTRRLAGNVAAAISRASGLVLRHPRSSGAVPRKNLGFLNNTTAPALLIEVCFVNSREDVRLYQLHFDEICIAIASALANRPVTP